MATSFHETKTRGGKRSVWLTTGASSLLAIALAMPAHAQAQAQTDLQNNVAPGATAPQPAVPVTANETSAAEADRPQEAATAQDV